MKQIAAGKASLCHRPLSAKSLSEAFLHVSVIFCFTFSTAERSNCMCCCEEEKKERKKLRKKERRKVRKKEERKEKKKERLNGNDTYDRDFVFVYIILCRLALNF